MRSKSIIQERLEAGKNRLEVITREVDAQRMSAPDVARGLRQVGAIFENMQRLIKSDKDVKFQQSINQKLEVGMNRLTSTISGLEGRGITNNNLNINLSQTARILDSIQELVDLEIETLA